MSMFCFQCEMTDQKTGACTVKGICGKDEQCAALEDVIVHLLKGIGMYGHRARALGASSRETDHFISDALFVTLTNVNFDPEALRKWIARGVVERDRVKALYTDAARASAEKLGGPAIWMPESDPTALLSQASAFRVIDQVDARGADIHALEELLIYGMKGVAAYTHHAAELGQEDDAIYAFYYKALDVLGTRAAGMDELLALCLECGEKNFRAMELLDTGHARMLGVPSPSEVSTTPVPGKAILVTGHDMVDLYNLLEQTEGTGINVYTHGEMLPAFGYPKLRAFTHLVGNWGGAWQDQRQDFDAFPGAILVTTNCIQNPRDSYRDRLFTKGVVGFEGVTHLQGHDYAPLIEAAKAAPGFSADQPVKAGRKLLVGFGHEAVLGVADKVVDAVKSGALRHIFVIGGCDGPRRERSYFTDLGNKVPDDCIILTLGCGKFRLLDHDYGTLGGLPRLIDMGQCNDAYAALKVATALADVFDTDVNSLPLSLDISWMEQKAISIFLTFLHLGVKNVRLGPTLPAFLTPNLINFLVENFGVAPVTTAEADLQVMLK